MTHPAAQLDNWTFWAEINPSSCPCKGRGWMSSDWDSYHKCGLHAGAPHPEEEVEDFDYKGHYQGLLRIAYMKFFHRSDLLVEEFIDACRENMDREWIYNPLLQDWVDAAEVVSNFELYTKSQKHAISQGYSCALEMNLSYEAFQERRCAG